MQAADFWNDRNAAQAMVKELQSLMRMLNENRRLALDRQLRTDKFRMEHMVAALKASRDQSQMMTKEKFEKMVKETADIMRRVGSLRRPKVEKTEDEKEDEDDSSVAEASADVQGQFLPKNG